MNSKYVLALTVGLNIVGGIIAGVLVGLGFDWATENWFGTKTRPWGLMFFFLIGIIAGFKNAYEDLKRIERKLNPPEEKGKKDTEDVLKDAKESGRKGGSGGEELKRENSGKT